MENKFNANVETITPEIARNLLRGNTNNRKLRKETVSYYAKMITKGEWLLNGETIIIGEDGRVLDGQHRLMACVEANKPFQSYVVWDMPNEVFSTIDRGLVRRSSDVFNIAGIRNRKNISGSIKLYLYEANRPNTITNFAFHYKVGSYYPTMQEMLDCYWDNEEVWNRASTFMSMLYKRCMVFGITYCVSIYGLLHLKFGYSKDMIEEFFIELFDSTKCNHDYLFRAHDMLLTNKNSSKKYNITIQLQLIRKCWDLYKEGRKQCRVSWLTDMQYFKPFC